MHCYKQAGHPTNIARSCTLAPRAIVTRWWLVCVCVFFIYEYTSVCLLSASDFCHPCNVEYCAHTHNLYSTSGPHVCNSFKRHGQILCQTSVVTVVVAVVRVLILVDGRQRCQLPSFTRFLCSMCVYVWMSAQRASTTSYFSCHVPSCGRASRQNMLEAAVHASAHKPPPPPLSPLRRRV